MSTPVIICAVFLIILAIFLTYTAGHYQGSQPVSAKGDCGSCDGADPHCEQTCQMSAATSDIEYYEDEELDTFIGRSSDSYQDHEVEMFSEVLYTMRPDEVAGWCRSLTLRGIHLPDSLKDEVVMMIKD